MTGWGVVAVLWIAPVCQAATLTVPGTFATIQEAVDGAAPGDEIVVLPGRYRENLSFHGTGVVLRSTVPTSPSIVAQTIVDGQEAGPVITFEGTEPTTCVLSGLTVQGGHAPRGAGILGNGTLATIEYCRITSNTAMVALYSNNHGGGLYDCDGPIRNNAILQNEAYDEGGGLYGCDGLIEDNRIEGNRAAQGGGLCNCQGTIRGNVISHGDQAFLGGGLVMCHGLIEDNEVRDNFAMGSGGGLYDCDGVIRRNLIVGNTTMFSGGGLDSCDGLIEQNRIVANGTGEDGGGVADCRGTIRANIIAHNVCSDPYMYMGWGAGVFLTTGTLVNNFIVGNQAYDGGAGVATQGGLIINNTIVGNWVYTEGENTFPGISGYRGEIRNCIVYSNSSGYSSTIVPQVGPSLTPAYSCIQNWTSGGTGNIALNPRLAPFVDSVARLLPNSPCIDAGGVVEGLTTDFEGDPRPYRSLPLWIHRGDGSDFDIGADEYIGPPVSWNGWVAR